MPNIAKTAWFRLVAFALGMALAVGLIRRLGTDPGPLRIGINVWPGYEYLYLAKVKGFFEEEHARVEIVEFGALLDSRRAFERGQIDGLATTAVEVVLSRSLTASSLQAVQILDWSDGGDVILSDSGHRDLASLRGAKIGVESGTVGVYLLSRALSTRGMGLKDVQLVSSNPYSLSSMLETGELNAVVTYPPFSVRSLRCPGIHEVYSSAKIPGEIVDLVAVGASVLRARPKDVEAMLRAYWRARAYASAFPREADSIMASREGISPGELEASFRSGVRMVDAGEQQGFMARGGRLESVMVRTDSLLRSLGEISGPSRIGHVVDGRFGATGVRP
jgi:NitT/TauT family transport system substrate-binding protein